jgi:phosphatidylethanolamine/phosphatidyl-N-methylethanolamine N-methyltransferase
LRPQQQQRERADDFGRFFRSWIQNPLAIGAVAPSSRLLAKIMAVGLWPGARVLELGAGTGTLTQAILDSGVEPEHLQIVECNAEFAALLRRRFPRCSVIEADAMTVAKHVAGAGAIDFVISGLPLVLFSAQQRRRLLTESFAVLAPHGVFRQFTYGGRCPIDRELRDRLGLESQLIGFAPFNLPPAFVYRLKRASTSASPSPAR